MLLAHDEIHVWRIWLDQQTPHLHSLNAVLSEDECARARRFRFETDRRRFIVRRGFLRVILGSCLDENPANLRFNYGPNGKPTVPASAGNALCFNLSHSDGLALYAVAWNIEVGIDVEHIRTVREAEQIAARYFSASEVSESHSLPGSHPYEWFFRLWTRHEACLKASGLGIAEGTAPLASRQSGNLKSAFPVIKQTQCALSSLAPAPGYIATLAHHQ